MGTVPRLRYDDPAALSLIREGKPVVLTESPLAVPAVAAWSPSYIAHHIGDIACTVFASRDGTFRYWDETKNEARYEFLEHTDKLEMRFAEFLAKKELLEERQAIGEPGASDGHTSLYLQQALIEGVGEQILADFKRFDWDLATKVQREAQFGELTSNLLLVGMADAVTPAHYDEQENLFAQVEGHKRVLLMDPNQFGSLYPFPVHHPCDRQSQVNFVQVP